MTKIYQTTARIRKTFVKKVTVLLAGLFVFAFAATAQNVTVTASAGLALRNYNTLWEAFQGINDGTHQGVIVVTINASTTEGTTPATLNSGNATPASYTSVTVKPSADGLSVTGNPAQGLGVVQLNGADNVTIDGDNPNTGGTNRNLSFVNSNANTLQFCSVIRIATSAAVTSANNITIQNCNINGNVTGGNANGFGASNENTFGIYAGGNGGATAVGAPTAITTSNTDFATAATTINALTITNNAINQCARGIAFVGESSVVCDGLTVTNNTIGNSGVAPATTVYSKGITVRGANAVTITGNTIQNILQWANNNLFGIEFSTAIGGGTLNINNNTISNVQNNGTSSDARGIMINAVGGAYTISGNTISGVESSATGLTSGIHIGATTAAGTIQKNIIHDVYSRNLGGAAGINMANVANGMVIQNNFIYTIKNNLGFTFSTLTRNVHGILVNSGSNHKIYHNSIHLFHASTATSSNFIACLTINNSGQTGIDIRNNIFVNTVSGGTASDAYVAIMMPFAAAGTMNLTLNNNGYYTGSIANKSGIAFAGTNVYNAANIYTVGNFNAGTTAGATNWRNFSSSLGVTSNDDASFGLTTGHPFVSNTDLHVPSGASQSALESGGASVGVTVDIDNDVRPGPAGSVNGGAILPDIGADEFDRQLLDKFPPTITFTPPVVCGSGARTFIATISDATGVPTAGAGLPVVYWRVNAGAWNANTATYISPTQYQFTVDPGGTALLGQLVEYYIVMQDIVAPPNVIASPSTGAGGYTTSPPAAGTPPTTFYSYTVTAGLAGVYTVGAAGTYPTLTAAVAAYNASCLGGAVTFNLIDATYPSETYPITINHNTTASATNTLTIKPAAGVTATISGNNGTALIKFNGSEYVTIDGSNNGSSSQNLTIQNTNANNSAAVIWIANGPTTATDGANFNTIKNTIISGNTGNTTLLGILSGGNVFGNNADAKNNNNTINNCIIRAAQYGIGLVGNTGLGLADQNWTITNNFIGSTTIANDKIGFRGIALFYINGFTITGNTIAGVIIPSGFTSTASGISLFSGVFNGTISHNKISDIKQQDSGGWGSNGIFLGTENAAAINIHNNFIWDVSSVGFGGVDESDNGYGMMVYTGSGYNIYYNSISMATSQTNSSSITAAINISTFISDINGLNIRNNIFSNTQSVGTRYAIYSAAPASVYQNINYNDYYFTGAALGFLSSARATLAAWQTATGKDANSVSINPNFISATDLHLQTTSLLNGLATPIAGITTDIDGTTRSVTVPDIGADEFNAGACSSSTGGIASASPISICGSGTVSLSASGYSLGDNIVYQWQSSPDNSTWSDIVGQTNAMGATSGTISTTTYFRLKVTCGASIGYSSNTLQVIVNNPQVLSATPSATRCGTGTVTLTATGSAGTTLDWYATATGGSILGSGGTFTTPTISASTTFYVAAQPNPPAYPSPLVSNYDFSASTGASLDPMSGATVIMSDAADLPPGTNGDDDPSAVQNIGFTFNFNGTPYTQFSASPDGWILLGPATAVTQFTNNVTSTTNIPKIYPYWDDHATGSDGDVSFVVTGSAPNRILKVQWKVRMPRTPLTSPYNTTFQAWLYEGSDKIEFRYGTMAANSNSASVGLTAGAANFQSVTVSNNTSSNGTANNSNSGQPPVGTMYTFNPPQVSCQSPRTAVPVTVTAAPAITASATPPTICQGQSTNLNVTSANSNYGYTWTPGPLSGASQTVSPLANTTYTVTALDPGTLCQISADVVVVVNTSPSIPVVSNDTTICLGGSATLTATSSTPSLVSDYNFAYSTGATLDPMTGATTIVSVVSNLPAGTNGDDAPSAVTPIGFTFNFNNTTYTQFSASPDGWIKLGAGAAVNQFTNNVTSTTNIPKIYPFWDDHSTGSDGAVSYLLTGSAPNRILKVQWKIRMPRLNLTDPSNTTFQAWLYEFDGKIEFRYGTMAAITSDASVGLTAGAANFQSVTVSTNTTSNTVPNNTITGQPALGTMYTFTPQIPTITWSPNVNLSSTTGSPVTASPISTQIYTATATGTNGCPRSSNVTVTVQNPTASVSIVASPSGAICSGTSVTFTATPTNGGTSPVYQWYVGATPVGANSPTYTTTTLNNGDVVTVKMTSNLTPCAPPQVTSNAITMTVNPNLPVSVSISANPGTTICAGVSVTFTAIPTNGGGSPSYQWYVGATPVGTNSPTYTTNTLTNGQVVTCVLTSNATCATGSPATSNALTMTVNPNLPVSVSIVGSNAGNPICTGTSVTFTATPTNGGGGPTYQWYVGATPVGTNSPTYTTTTLANGDVVTCVLTSNATCPTGSPATSNAITMTVTGSAPAAVTLTPSAACAGQTITLTANPTNQGATPTYEFFVNTISVQNGASATYTYTPIAGDQAYVVLTSSLLCPNPNNATSATITINPQAAPVIAATATCTTLYSGSGQQTTLSANATTATGTITSYQWNIGGVPIGGATAATYTTSVAGSYTVTVGNSNGCFTTNTGSPIVISVVTTPLPAGTYTIPGSACNTFSSIATAITYINTYGVSGSGGVIFNITGGYTETTPVGGFRITAKGTAANNIVFQKASGANPVITAAVPNAGSLNDAIFKLVGADYIVIRSLTLQEHATAANTTPGTNNQTEWGVALLQASLTDGSQNDSIVGNTISLNRNYANSFGVYSNATHSETVPGTATVITNATGSHSNNRVISNIISNVNVGIAFVGSASGGFYDSGNDIGGSSSAYGNTITNWGGAALASTYANAPASTVFGLLITNQLGENLSYNTLTSASFTGAAINTRGIWKTYTANPAGNTFTSTISNNSVSIAAGFTSGSFELNPIRTEGITTAVATATINITNNTILNCSTANGSTPTTIMINNLSTNLPGTMNINDNIIKAFNSLAVAGTFTGISSTGAIATISISNNQIGDNVANDINTAAGTITGILNTTGVSATKTMSGNQIRNLTGVAATTAISTIAGTNPFTIQSNIISTLKGSNVVGITLGATAGQVTLTGNNISNLSGTGQINGFTVSTGPTATIDNNTVSTLSTTSASAFVTAVQNSGISTITNNVFSNLSINSGAPNNASVYGILQGGGTPVVIAGNTISGLTSNSISGNGTSTGLVDGVYIAAGTNVSVRKNRIFDLSVTGASATTTVYGVHIAAGTSDTIHNNYISDLRAPSSSNPDAIRAIGNTNATASANYFVYYNTIYLKATSSQTTFGTSGIYHNAQATSTTSQLFLRNNIIVNESTPGSTSGITVAIRRSGANLGNYNTASNNNALYAGIASAKNLLYYDGTNSSQTLAQMQGIASFSPRENVSLETLPNFINSTTTPYDLHLVSNLNCAVSGAAAPIATFTYDYENDSRDPSTPDIGADEFTGSGAGAGVWRGVDNVWTNINNWCGEVPKIYTNVTIPNAAPNYPLITTATPVCNNITINAGGTVTVQGAGKLGIYGTISNSGTFDVTDGTIEMAGTSAVQTIPANSFLNDDIKNLIISNNNSGNSVSLGGTLKLYGKLSFTKPNSTFATAGNLTLRSTATGTAYVGDITNNGTTSGNSITGDVTVERFATARRAWRYLSVPTQHNLQTIHEAWQENQAANATTPAGYGIHITKDSANWNTTGFDLQTTPGPSVKYFVQGPAGSWKGITSTINIPGVNDGKFGLGVGYMTLVRGDRTVNSFPQPATTTVLREKGALYTGTLSLAAGANNFVGYGNPYASAIDLTKLTLVGFTPFAYVWDPQLGTLGAYQTLSFSGGNYTITPGGGSYGAGGSVVNTIQSGQAFILKATAGGGVIGFTEPSKVDGSSLVSRPALAPVTNGQLRTNIYTIDGNTGAENLFDGTLQEFDASYSNAIDDNDAIKMQNFGENIGIKSGDKVLSIERRSMPVSTDTVYYNLAQVRAQNYKFEFSATNMAQSGLTAFLEDTYLHTYTPVSLDGSSTWVDFTIINNPGSYAADRFRLVFKQSAPVPVTFSSIKATRKNANILVEWKVENEINIHHYDVEKSTDGLHFSKVHETAATGNGSGTTVSYNWLDTNPQDGNNFYRVKSVGITGDNKLSQTVKVSIDKQAEIAIFPNPVREDGIIYVSMGNQQAGVYQVTVVNTKGQVVMKQSLNHTGGNAVYNITLDKYVAHGNYLVSVIGPDNHVKLTNKVVY